MKPTAKTATTSAAAPCAGGFKGGITATLAIGGELSGVQQYVCASTAIIPPYNGPDPSTGGSGQTFSFKATTPSALGPATLNNAISIVILAPPSVGAYDLSTVVGYIQYGYLNDSFCNAPTGNITITSLGAGTVAGTFVSSGLCDMNGNVEYPNFRGSFHIP